MDIPNYTVTAIPAGWMTIERSTMVLGSRYRESIDAPLWCTAIGGGAKKILVDTGVHDRAWVNDHIGPCSQAPEERLDRALREYVGWTVDDVDIVINTHLHFDHCGGNALFPNATYLIQAAEWRFSRKPVATQQDFYCGFLFGRERIDFFRWVFVHGVHDVLPGVRIFPTPGHTPGHQSVAVKTRDGIVVVAGDCANCMENIREEIPVGVLHDADQEIESLRQIKALADLVIPGHDPAVEPGSPGLEIPTGATPAPATGVRGVD
jgi:glyoxylase-like metal-dependent hydrolase (beta-lactamase superfamily II)